MSAWHFHAIPPADWAAQCASDGALFHSELWLRLLQDGFGAEPLFGLHAASRTRLPLTVFKAGPFRIGYAGFPCSALQGSVTALAELGGGHFERPVDLLRASLPGMGTARIQQAPSASVPETIIEHLQGWSAAALPKLERDLKKASRSDLVVMAGGSAEDAEDWHRLYLQTVQRHDGQARYPQTYFRALLRRLPQPRFAAWHALHQGQLAGFCIAAIDAGTGYYLHGAVDPSCRSLGVTDRLLAEAIRWAQKAGAVRFSLMASPPTQPGLIRYKEKWGGITRPLHSWEWQPRPLRAAAFKQAVALRGRWLALTTRQATT